MKKTIAQAQPVKLRVEGDELIAKAAILALKKAGFNIQNLSKAYSNRNNDNVRYYLELQPQSHRK